MRGLSLPLLSVLLAVWTWTASAQSLGGPLAAVPLRWGMSDRDFVGLGFRIVGADDIAGRIKRFYFAADVLLPAATIAASVGIDSRYGLQKTWWRGHLIEDDPYGDEGRKVFAAVRADLVSDYGEPAEEAAFSGRVVFRDPTEFYQCLDYTGCGARHAFWYPDDGSVIFLRLVGIRKGTGYIEVTHEGPDWSEIGRERREEAP